MPRTRTPTGKNETVSVKVSDATVARIDKRWADRGFASRSEYIQWLIDVDLDLGDIKPRAGRASVAADPPAVTFLPPPLDPADCPHRGLNPGAWCKGCGSTVPEKPKKR